MPANVEIKARVADINTLLTGAADVSKSEGEVIMQEDTFFHVPMGRLKLRELQGNKSELIFYERPDVEGPKISDFRRTDVQSAADLKKTLGLALGVKGVVKKHRTLFLVGQTRVHVDVVDDLGDFMELEVMLQPGQTAEEGQTIAEDLMDKLGIQQEDLIQGAYMDLLLRKQGPSLTR